MKYLEQYNAELLDKYNELFKSTVLPPSEDFYRDSERYQTIQDVINLEYEDMETFYDQTSMGQISSITE